MCAPSTSRYDCASISCRPCTPDSRRPLASSPDSRRPLASSPDSRRPLACNPCTHSNYYVEMVGASESGKEELGEFRCVRAKGKFLFISTEANAKVLMEANSVMSSRMMEINEYEFHRSATDAVKEFKKVGAFVHATFTCPPTFPALLPPTLPPTVRLIHSCVRPRTLTFNSLPSCRITNRSMSTGSWMQSSWVLPSPRQRWPGG